MGRLSVGVVMCVGGRGTHRGYAHSVGGGGGECEWRGGARVGSIGLKHKLFNR